MLNFYICAKSLNCLIQTNVWELTTVEAIILLVHVTLKCEQLSRQSVRQKLPSCLKALILFSAYKVQGKFSFYRFAKDAESMLKLVVTAF